MTSWSGYENHVRVGIDWSIVPANPTHADTSVKVTWRYYVDTDGYTFDDDETLHESATGWGGTDDGFHNGSSGAAILVGTHAETYGISANSGSVSASCSLSGVYNGATPSHSVTVNLPNQPPPSVTVPSSDLNPNFSNNTDTTLDVSWSLPSDNGGATVDYFQLEVDDSSGYGSPAYNESNLPHATVHVTGLTPNTYYYARVRAHNSAGWGAWTVADGNFDNTLPGPPLTPGVPSMSSRTQTSLTWAWTPANSQGGGAVTYTVQMSATSDFAVIEQQTTTTGTSVVLTGLAPGSTHYLRVWATNSVGSSSTTPAGEATTLPALVYNDSGDFATLVNNLAHAVGDKLVHLGNSMTRCHTTLVSFTENATTYLTMPTLVADHGADAPTYLGGSTWDNMQINYPGTYLLELGITIDETHASTSAGYVGPAIYVNGVDRVAPDDDKVGIFERWPSPNGSVSGAERVLSIVRRLDEGDTVGWGVFMNANNGQTSTPTADNGGGVHAYCRVTMIGF